MLGKHALHRLHCIRGGLTGKGPTGKNDGMKVKDTTVKSSSIMSLNKLLFSPFSRLTCF